MKTKHALQAAMACLLSFTTLTFAADPQGGFGTVSVGFSKEKLHRLPMRTQWTIADALAVTWPFRFEHSVCVMVRGGRVLLLGDAAQFSGVHDLPVKPGDSFHRYSEADVKAWNLPVFQERDAIRILKEEALKAQTPPQAPTSTATTVKAG